MRRILLSICGLRRAFPLLAISAAALALGGCNWGVLDPKGPVGVDQRLILVDSVAIMLVIVLPVLAATVGFAWWFRASNTRAFYWPDWEFSGTIEIIVWSIPLLVVVVLGGVAWFGSHELDPYKPLPLKPGQKALEVQVVSLDWKWLFIYPEQKIAAVNTLYIPTDRPVHFDITSATVWNTFFIPQLGGMIYSMSGMTTQLHLQADHVGVYRGISGMLSGDKFADMYFDTHAVSEDDFKKWVSDTKGAGDTLDTANYAKLAQTSDTAPISTYKDVDPKLFASIVNLTAPEPAGPPKLTNAP